jgi:hypothetical protein
MPRREYPVFGAEAAGTMIGGRPGRSESGPAGKRRSCLPGV